MKLYESFETVSIKFILCSTVIMKMKKLNSKVCLRVLFHVTFKNVQRALDLIEVHCALGLKKNK